MRRLLKRIEIPSKRGVAGVAAALLTSFAVQTGLAQPSAGDFTWTAGTYFVSERETIANTAPSIPGARVTVTRTNGASGRVLIDYTTTPGSATPGNDYTTRSGTLFFDDFQMSASFVVPIID